MYLVGFPLLLIPFAIYNIIALLMPGISWAEAVTRVRLPSGGEWTMSLGDMLVAFSIFLLLVEVIKAYRHGGRYLMDHGLSILLFVAMAAEFYLFPRAATATFFLMMVASFADVVGGLVAMRRRRVSAQPAPDEVFTDAPAENEAPADTPATPEAPAPTERRTFLKSPRAFGVERDPPPATKPVVIPVPVIVAKAESGDGEKGEDKSGAESRAAEVHAAEVHAAEVHAAEVHAADTAVLTSSSSPAEPVPPSVGEPNSPVTNEPQTGDHSTTNEVASDAPAANHLASATDERASPQPLKAEKPSDEKPSH